MTSQRESWRKPSSRSTTRAVHPKRSWERYVSKTLLQRMSAPVWPQAQILSCRMLQSTLRRLCRATANALDALSRRPRQNLSLSWCQCQSARWSRKSALSQPASQMGSWRKCPSPCNAVGAAPIATMMQVHTLTRRRIFARIAGFHWVSSLTAKMASCFTVSAQRSSLWRTCVRKTKSGKMKTGKRRSRCGKITTSVGSRCSIFL
mmetsp:Transcript_61169/g.107086  ORF Transcript_61169/g.107086 Transcript_61169/m.107086 type:complete len:205 (-) Transcript_61169:315-929(-)